MRSAGLALAFVALVAVLAAAALDAERLLRRARVSRAVTEPRAPLDLRGLVATPTTPASLPRVLSRRRRASRRPLPPLDPRAERRAFERWRAEVLRRDDDSSRSSEDADPEDLDASPPRAHTDVDSRQSTSAVPTPHDEDVGSTGSDESTPPDDREDADEPYGGDVEQDPRDESPATRSTDAPASPPTARPTVRTALADGSERTTRSRRENGDTQRRTERVRPENERRGTPARLQARKERAAKRRSERAPPTPPPRSPAPPASSASGAVRWGASWSSVVAARGTPAGATPLAPIGSDVRRREPERTPDNSLFYFNGSAESARDAEFAWRRPLTADRPSFALPARDYLDETRTQGAAVGSGFGGAALGSVWGGGWGAWGAGLVRPPPGFAPPEPRSPPRSYDPFRSLASIWAPAPNDWRAAPAAPTGPAAPGAAGAPRLARDDLE